MTCYSKDNGTKKLFKNVLVTCQIMNKFHCTVCNVNFKCGSGSINDIDNHANLQKHKENSKVISSNLQTYILILTLSLAFLLYAFRREEVDGTSQLIEFTKFILR